MKKPGKRGTNTYLRYSSLFFQMLASVGLLAWGGNWLDGYWNFSQPILTIVGMFLGLGASFYQIYKELKRDETE